MLLLPITPGIYSQDLRPRWQSAGRLDQLQLAAGDQVAEAGALDRAAVRLVVRQSRGIGDARESDQREEADGKRDRVAPPPLGEKTTTPRRLRAPRHRAYTNTRAGGERVPLFRFNRSPRDAHAIPSSRIRKTTSLLDERIAIITKERRVPSLRVRVRSRSRSIESKQTLSPLPSKTQRPTHHDDAYGTTQQRWTRDPIIALPCVKTA